MREGPGSTRTAGGVPGVHAAAVTPVVHDGCARARGGQPARPAQPGRGIGVGGAHGVLPGAHPRRAPVRPGRDVGRHPRRRRRARRLLPARHRRRDRLARLDLPGRLRHRHHRQSMFARLQPAQGARRVRHPPALRPHARRLSVLHDVVLLLLPAVRADAAAHRPLRAGSAAQNAPAGTNGLPPGPFTINPARPSPRPRRRDALVRRGAVRLRQQPAGARRGHAGPARPHGRHAPPLSRRPRASRTGRLELPGGGAAHGSDRGVRGRERPRDRDPRRPRPGLPCPTPTASTPARVR